MNRKNKSSLGGRLILLVIGLLGVICTDNVLEFILYIIMVFLIISYLLGDDSPSDD